ncbi:esterase FrsA [Budvicia diplopodorum]|uniref:esterase FrsA n=1 Tax=Budvicia diplopodorum TaxID=1119056 RepID=UPI00135BEDD0|nr:esterase FrsA [Budvicia diplopodorum]
MPKANLSEVLFKPSFKHPETSTLVKRVTQASAKAHSSLDGESQSNWYRMINLPMWAWRGIDPIEVETVLSRIAVSGNRRTNEALLDTVVGYRGGNWIYEWAKEGMQWQKEAQNLACNEPEKAGNCWIKASNFYSIASYPHLRGDMLAEQAALLADRAYREAAECLPFELKPIDFNVDGNVLTGFLHIPPTGDAPYPTVLLCGGLDNFQSDYYPLFRDYLAPKGIAMLYVDLPSIGSASRWTLTEDTSQLHQQVLIQLDKVPWIDHQRVVALGVRFGANVAVRLGYLETRRLRGVACIGPIVHDLLTNKENQHRTPDVYLDIIASRLKLDSTADSLLYVELSRYSLKIQGLLGRRCAIPMCSMAFENDIFSPLSESKLITSSASEGKTIKVAATPLKSSFNLGLEQLTEWIHQKLC